MKARPVQPSTAPESEADFELLREEMVATQLAKRGIHDPRVLEAMRRVPRHRFVAPELRSAAYADRPLEIGHGQTISQPFTVAFMAQALHLQGEEKVLEIGTGCGYGAAVLGQLCGQVHSVERLPRLADTARRRLAQLGYDNVRVYQGDGTLGLPAHAPYDAIVVTAGAARLPEPYFKQLAEGGRLVIPLDQLPHRQAMYCFQRRGQERTETFLGNFVFVPLISNS
jgi:protein-L-isoaspartate(D-aspartate) O-methyltransferase